MTEQDDGIGVVVAVCSSDTREYPKFPKDIVIVGKDGIVGDAHSGPLRPSHSKPGTLVPNNRAISIVSDEVRADVSQSLNLEIDAGDFNENILVKGLDL